MSNLPIKFQSKDDGIDVEQVIRDYIKDEDAAHLFNTIYIGLLCLMVGFVIGSALN